MKRRRGNSSALPAQAMATVTSCHYEFGAGQALAFGIPRTRHFQIAFNYWANGELHTGEFASSKAIPQGTLFPLTYNPDSPHENSKSQMASKSPGALVMVLAAGLVSAAVCAIVLHGCAPVR